MTRHDAADRIGRLSSDINHAYRIKSLFDDPEVLRWFDMQERQAIDRILASETDDARRASAADLKALRNLRTHLGAVVAAGDRAAATLKKIGD